MPDAGVMTHLSVRACAVARYFRERAEEAKIPLGKLGPSSFPPHELEAHLVKCAGRDWRNSFKVRRHRLGLGKGLRAFLWQVMTDTPVIVRCSQPIDFRHSDWMRPSAVILCFTNCGAGVTYAIGHTLPDGGTVRANRASGTLCSVRRC